MSEYEVTECSFWAYRLKVSLVLWIRLDTQTD